MLFDPMSEFVFTRRPRRYSFHNLYHFHLVGIEPISVPKQKRPDRKKTRPLVPIDERMIPHDAVTVRRSELKERWIRKRVPVSRSIKGAFEPTLIA